MGWVTMHTYIGSRLREAKCYVGDCIDLCSWFRDIVPDTRKIFEFRSCVDLVVMTRTVSWISCARNERTIREAVNNKQSIV